MIFRAFIAVGSLFFVIWGSANEIVAVQVDTVIFNSIFVIINILQSIPLILKLLPIKLTLLENEIYNRDFKSYLTPNQFKLFISSFESEMHSTNNSQLCTFGQTFNELIYIAKIYEGFDIDLRSEDNRIMSQATEGSWIGVIEYSKREQYMTIPEIHTKMNNDELEVTWGVSATLNIKNNSIVNKYKEVLYDNDNMEYQLLKPKNKGCKIYRVNLTVHYNLQNRNFTNFTKMAIFRLFLKMRCKLCGWNTQQNTLLSQIKF